MSPSLLMLCVLAGHHGRRAQDRRLVQPLYQEARESASRMWPAPARVALQATIAAGEAQQLDQLDEALADSKSALAQALALQPSPETNELKAWVELSAIHYIAFREPAQAAEYAAQADTNLDAIWADVFQFSHGRIPPGQIFAIFQQVRLKTGSFPCKTAAEAVRLFRAHPPTDTQQLDQLKQQLAAADCVPAHIDWLPPPPPSPLSAELESLDIQLDPTIEDVAPITQKQVDAAWQRLRTIEDRLLRDPSLWRDNLDAIAWMPYAMQHANQPAEAHRWAQVVLDHIFESLNLRCVGESAQPDQVQTLWRAMRWRFSPAAQQHARPGSLDPVEMVGRIAWGDFDDTLARVRASDCILKPLMLAELALVADGPDN